MVLEEAPPEELGLRRLELAHHELEPPEILQLSRDAPADIAVPYHPPRPHLREGSREDHW